MECPKCHTKVKDSDTVCPKCHKVLLLECPNCHSLGEDSVCQKCGYTILIKCSKCSKIVPTEKEFCSKCNFPTSTSIAYQECENDEFASITIEFASLKEIKRKLKNKDLYLKFFYKLKNLLYAQIQGVDCKLITYENKFAINFNKELSLATSSNKAVRIALKIINSFVNLNSNLINELSLPLSMTLTITKKLAENLQKLPDYKTNVKILSTGKKNKKDYLKGFQIILDQYVWDTINKDFKTDSLYSNEKDGQSTMFYEIILDQYVLPPSEESSLEPESITPYKKQETVINEKESEEDLYSFRVFDINAKCTFKKTNATSIYENLASLDYKKKDKIIAIKTQAELNVSTLELANFYESLGFNVLKISCREELAFEPWGYFKNLFKNFYGLAYHNNYNENNSLNEKIPKTLYKLLELIYEKPLKAMSAEDARFAYMELWAKFLSKLDNTVIITESFEHLDDTSIQTLELYFDKYKNIKPNFVFIATDNNSVHSKIKNLLRTECYTEFAIKKSSLDSCLSTLKSDATDFIQSFYYEKIKENFNGSYLYFINAIQYLKETGILIDFENKLLIKNKKSVILPKNLTGLYKARFKNLNKENDISLILAYSALLDPRLDIQTLKALGIKEFKSSIEILCERQFARFKENNFLYLENYNIVSPIIASSINKNAEDYLIKNIAAQLGKGLNNTTLALIMGKLGAYKEEYLTLWKNSQIAITTGDFDAYLKNCLGFLTLIEHIKTDFDTEKIEENKKDIYNNILLCLYNYSPEKIYFIENILLTDAIRDNDNDKIVKLSNIMLQGALVSSNYTDALSLLHNILTRLPHPTLIVDGAINTKFLLLSLVNIEILYNVGRYKDCAEIAEEILEVLTPEILEKIKPTSFSLDSFLSHILETLRIAGFAKLFLLDDSINNYFERIKDSLGVEFPEKDCLLAIKDFLAGKIYSTGNIEEYSAFSKAIFLILQELSINPKDYKRFAQNIYQAKLLANDIKHKEIELFCDILIGYSYAKIGIKQKAIAIYNDILEYAEKSFISSITTIVKYAMVQIHKDDSPEEALLIVNDALAQIRKSNNDSKIMYTLFEKIYINIAQEQNIESININAEEQKIKDLTSQLAGILSENIEEANT